MIYEGIKEGTFVSRENRFIANVIVDGRNQVAHVKNTGRCKELLVPGANVYLQQHFNSKRKTQWSLITVEKNHRMINMDSQAPNKVFLEWLKNRNDLRIQRIKPEFSYGNSRFDFLVETDTEKILIEVKGVTLEEDGVVLFPDAPTERGVRHVLELIESLKDGYRACVVFIIQMKGVKYFTPNTRTHPEFAKALKKAMESGVELFAFDCDVDRQSMTIGQRVDIVI